MSTTNRITPEQLEGALTTLRAAYWQHVNGLVEEVRESLADDPDQDPYDVIHEICDVSEWAIYTGKAILALYCTESDDEIAELCSTSATSAGDYSGKTFAAIYASDDGSPDYSAMAFAVIRGDVTKAYQS